MKLADARRKTFQTEMLPHMKALYYFALKKTLDPDDAADLMQDTYLNAFRYMDKYKSGTNAKGWLYRIMMNSFINSYRKKSKEPDRVSYDDIKDFYLVMKEPASETNELQQKMIDNQFGDEIAEAMRALANDYRTVIILYDIEGYTYEEIADLVKIPIGTVRSRLHRGRMILRSMLRDYASTHGYALSDEENGAEQDSEDAAVELFSQQEPVEI